MDVAELPELLLSSARRGSEDAIGHLHAAVHPTLLDYVAAYEPDIAEELARDIWLAVALSLRRYRDEPGRFRAWVFTIARRRLQRIQADPRSRRAYDGAGLVPQPLRERRDGAARVDATRLALGAIATLEPDARDLFVLRTRGRLSRDEAARVLGLRLRRVEDLERRAVASLAAALVVEPSPT